MIVLLKKPSKYRKPNQTNVKSLQKSSYDELHYLIIQLKKSFEIYIGTLQTTPSRQSQRRKKLKDHENFSSSSIVIGVNLLHP